ncbi:terpene synthase [Corynespora cassiicola Philippines]|uniref:Terpene cyclase/mutase family member n=1 Tax=Corynespora cassiicola Philippines TaxID=1448308 RepID=A0A2T2NEG1_CORCC|nr:terpene synthase [Corynespora cassiicola Philippines]
MLSEPRTSVLPKTDTTRWRLESNNIGVNLWHYLTEEELPKARLQTRAEKYFLGLPAEIRSLPPAQTFDESARNGLVFYEGLQQDAGHWTCSYGGPSFLLPGIVFAMYITKKPIPEEWKIEMTRWICKHQNEDGGWGLHTFAETTVNATVLYYITLRILGMREDHSIAVKARRRLKELGGALQAPQWARYWLAVLNLFEWEGIAPVPAEMWMLPDWVPFHPWRWWIHCRAVYLPVSYLYSNKCQVELDDFLKAIRREIFVEPYELIRFSANMHTVGPLERKQELSIFLTVANHSMRLWETWLRPLWVRGRADDTVRDLLKREDENTEYNDIAPVNKAFHIVAAYFIHGLESKAVRKHHDKILPYLWMGDDGINCGGTNGTQLWDTEFSVIGIVESGLGTDPRFRTMLEKAHRFLEVSQIRDDLPDPYRQRRKGGWPFSTKDNGYIVSDCAAEGLKATLLLQEELGFDPLISQDRLQDCVDTLLLMQNKNGGFGSYEKTRCSTYVEMFNPAELFDRCMVEYSYPECTCAVISSFALFRKHYPSYRASEIKSAIKAGGQFIQENQRTDGSWYGSWAVCFTYGTMFGIEGLVAAGHDYETSASIRRACKFLVGKQRDDGGWGEHWTSCEKGVYVDMDSQVVMTAWACLGLMSARYPDARVVSRGLELIRSRQQSNGEWLQESIEGIFNCTCTIEYPNYKFHFPIRALGRYQHDYIPALRILRTEKA